MDFSKILNLANDNKNRALEQEKMRKLAMKAKMKQNIVTNDAVKKFLERRDLEKRKNDAHEAQKRDELLSLRAAAKNNRKASAMAKRTKDNNFGGDGSEPASSVETKVKTQENLRPNHVKAITNYVNNRQNRREIASKPLPTKSQENDRSRTHVPQRDRNGRNPQPPSTTNNNKSAATPQQDKHRFEKKQGKINFPTKKLASTMDFNSLINLAKTKQHEPIKIPEKRIEEDARLMTQAEKRRYLEEQARKLGISVIIPGETEKPAQNVKANGKKQMPATKSRAEPLKMNKNPSSTSKVPSTTPSSRDRAAPAQTKSTNAKQMLPPPPKPRPAPVRALERKEFPPRDLMPINNKPRLANDTQRAKITAVGRQSKFANDSINRRREMGPPNARRGPPMYRPEFSRPKRRFDDDEDDDCEMGDFIDDGPGENGDEDYSKHIREIFGYDKRKYSMLDDDDCIESSFSRQMQEESYSARVGLLEDLEDIKREQEDLERQYKSQKKRKLKL